MEPLLIGGHMGLSLPTIQRRAVQSLTTTDPMSHVREASSRARALSSFAGAAEKATNLAINYVKTEDQADMRSATLAVHQSDMDFRAANEGKEEFNIMEVDDENFINIADGLNYEPEDVVPSHKVYAEWRNQNYKDSVVHASKGIRDSSVRTKFLQDHAAKGDSQYAGDAVQSRKKQIKYITRQTMAEVDESILKRDFTAARIAVSGSGMSTEAIGAANKKIDKREQADYFEETIEKKSIPQMEKALNELITNDPKVTSELSAREQRMLAGPLRTAINVEKNAIRAGANSGLKIAHENLKTMTEAVQNMERVDLTKMGANMTALRASFPVSVQRAEWALDNQPIIGDILMQPPEVQMDRYQELVAESTGSAEDLYKNKQVREAIEKDQRLYQSDPIKRANDTGFIRLESMDYSSPATVAEGLQKRLKQATSVQEWHRAFKGFFTNGELAQFGNYIENKSIPEQLDIFGGISASLGENAATLYEQLKTNGVAGTASIAGQLIAKGPEYRTAAENILKGADLRKNNVVTQQKIKDASLDATITAKFGMLFAGNKKHQSLMAEAFKDIYAMTEDSDTAFEQLVGEVIEYRGGGVIQSPALGVGFYTYDSHLKDIMPEWWAGTDRQAYGYTPEQLREGVIEGSLTQIGVGEKTNNLMASDGSIVTRPDGATPLVFSIDMKEPTMGARNKAIDEKNKLWLENKKKARKQKEAAKVQEEWKARTMI